MTVEYWSTKLIAKVKPCGEGGNGPHRSEEMLTKVRVHANTGGPGATPNVAAGRDAVSAMAQSVRNATKMEVSKPLVPQSHVIGVGDDGGAERALGVEAKAPPGSVERYGVARGKCQKQSRVR